MKPSEVVQATEEHRLLSGPWKRTMAGDLEGRACCDCGVGFVGWHTLIWYGKWYTNCTCGRLEMRHNRGPDGFIHQ